MKLCRRKTKKDKLKKQYEKKLAEAHKASTSSRSRADQLIAEAEDILKQIDNEN